MCGDAVRLNAPVLAFGLIRSIGAASAPVGVDVRPGPDKLDAGAELVGRGGSTGFDDRGEGGRCIGWLTEGERSRGTADGSCRRPDVEADPAYVGVDAIEENLGLGGANVRERGGECPIEFCRDWGGRAPRPE